MSEEIPVVTPIVSYGLNGLHAAAMAELAATTNTVNIHGRRYTTVATRVEIFRKHFGVLGRLRVVEQVELDERIFMRAIIELYDPRMAEMHSSGWVAVAEGRAEEVRGSSAITTTSALEVCETSAYGRALANFGLHGGEFASANEVENAIEQQKSHRADPRGEAWKAADTRKVTEYRERIMTAIDEERDPGEIWREVKGDHDFATALWATLPKPVKDKLRTSL